MKTLIQKLKHHKVIVFFLMFVLICPALFAQSKLGTIVSKINYEFAVPVICVIAVFVFLLKSFVSQKNH